MTLNAGATVTFEAIDPNTGAQVTGVTVSQVALHGINYAPDFDTPAGQFEPILPLFAPVPEQPDAP